MSGSDYSEITSLSVAAALLLIAFLAALGLGTGALLHAGVGNDGSEKDVGPIIMAMVLFAVFVVLMARSDLNELQTYLFLASYLGPAAYGWAHFEHKAAREAGDFRYKKAQSEPFPHHVYEKLLTMKGCGPQTAKRIIVKVDAGQKLTEREQQFWNGVN